MEFFRDIKMEDNSIVRIKTTPREMLLLQKR